MPHARVCACSKCLLRIWREALRLSECRAMAVGPGQGDRERPQRVMGKHPLSNRTHSAGAGAELLLTRSPCLRGSPVLSEAGWQASEAGWAGCQVTENAPCSKARLCSSGFSDFSERRMCLALALLPLGEQTLRPTSSVPHSPLFSLVAEGPPEPQIVLDSSPTFPTT